VSDIDQLQIRWFDDWLKGRDSGQRSDARVRLFDMGENVWREFPSWPGKPTSLFLDGSGRALRNSTAAQESVVACNPTRRWPHGARRTGAFNARSVQHNTASGTSIKLVQSLHQ
jgi:predicted acyl esterase